MRWVEVAAIRPHRCAVVPFVGQHHPKGFIDTGSELDGFDNHVYVSVVAVEEMARLVGWCSGEEQRVLRAELAAAAARCERAEAERDDLREKFDAIDLLGSEGFRARKAPGRPKKKEMA